MPPGSQGCALRPEEDPVRRVGTADADDLEPAPLDRPADRCDRDKRTLPDRVEPLLEVGEAIGLGASHVQRGAGHRDVQTHAVPGEPLHGDRLPHLPVLRDDRDLQFVGDRPRPPVIDVVEVPELEPERGAGPGVELKVEVARRAVRRGSLVVVVEVDQDRAVEARPRTRAARRSRSRYR